jgi:hypothetical protein
MALWGRDRHRRQVLRGVLPQFGGYPQTPGRPVVLSTSKDPMTVTKDLYIHIEDLLCQGRRSIAVEYLTRLGLSNREAESQVQGVQRELILAQRRRFELAEKRKKKKPKGCIARR